MYKYLSILFVVTAVKGIHEPGGWRPITPSEYFQESSAKQSFQSVPSDLNDLYDQPYATGELNSKDQCAVYKVGFTQDLYFQYVQYKTEIPDMKQFTLCFWSKFYNHSNDHPIFSYAVDGQPRAIYSWVSNTNRSSYFSLSVSGHTFYRLNYPLRLNRWYHTCQSWNGKSGEWQIWVNAERVGRGFHNRLVGHVIPGSGIAITGQEQSQLGGGFQEGPGAPKGAGGMLGEITMLQLYRVALTAGKAHKDHKHHHAHQFDHEGRIITTPAPATPRNVSPLPQHPLLTGGQINPMVKLNFAGGQPGQQPQIVPGQQFAAQYLNGQFVGNLVTQQLSRTQPQPTVQPQQLFVPNQQLQNLPAPEQIPAPREESSFSTQFLSLGDTPVLNTGLNHLQSSDNYRLDTHDLFKRNDESVHQNRRHSKREIEQADTEVEQEEDSSRVGKRQVFLGDGSFINEPIDTNPFQQSLLFGLAGIGENVAISKKQKESDEREPAEAEVKAVLNICTGCDEEPFDKALIFGWRTVPKKLYSGAYYTPAVPECKVF